MDSKVKLLKEFYSGLPSHQAKVETCNHGFAFLEKMLSDGALLDYGEMHRAGHVFYLSANGIWLVDHVPVPFIGFPL